MAPKNRSHGTHPRQRIARGSFSTCFLAVDARWMRRTQTATHSRSSHCIVSCATLTFFFLFFLLRGAHCLRIALLSRHVLARNFTTPATCIATYSTLFAHHTHCARFLLPCVHVPPRVPQPQISSVRPPARYTPSPTMRRSFSSNRPAAASSDNTDADVLKEVSKRMWVWRWCVRACVVA
jgi:hypothetical protein